MRQKLLMHTGSDCVLYAGLSWQVVVGFGGVKRLQREAVYTSTHMECYVGRRLRALAFLSNRLSRNDVC